MQLVFGYVHRIMDVMSCVCHSHAQLMKKILKEFALCSFFGTAFGKNMLPVISENRVIFSCIL